MTHNPIVRSMPNDQHDPDEVIFYEPGQDRSACWYAIDAEEVVAFGDGSWC